MNKEIIMNEEYIEAICDNMHYTVYVNAEIGFSQAGEIVSYEASICYATVRDIIKYAHPNGEVIQFGAFEIELNDDKRAITDSPRTMEAIKKEIIKYARNEAGCPLLFD